LNVSVSVTSFFLLFNQLIHFILTNIVLAFRLVEKFLKA
jgi:hypothetical protein